jgi:hypothetical protein
MKLPPFCVLTNELLAINSRVVSNPGGELKTPCTSRVFQPLPQRDYAGSFVRAGNSSFPLGVRRHAA